MDVETENKQLTDLNFQLQSQVSVVLVLTIHSVCGVALVIVIVTQLNDCAHQPASAYIENIINVY